MAIIPILCFALMAALFIGPWRERFLLASLTWGVCVLILTEVLSVWHGLTCLELALAWGVVLLILVVLYGILKPRWPPFPRVDFKIVLILVMVTAILLLTAVTAYYAAPNNWDSMTYHMARVAHWAQDKTIAMYPTAILRQIFYPPWSSYAITQFYILTDGDRWSNFIQWFSSLGSMVGVSLIARRLKATPLAQAFASLIAATIPMGILQSTSTQSDYVVAFWLVCFVYFGLGLLQEGRWAYTLAAGAGLGLAGLVKGTGYVYGLPFLVCMAAVGLKTQGKKFVLHMSAILLIVVLLNSSYYVRNFSATGRILPPTENSNIIAPKGDMRVIAANFVLNLGLHGATTWDGLNRLVEDAVAQAHAWLGIEEGDPRVGMVNGVKFQILSSSFRTHEDYAGNLFHTLLIFFCLIAALFLGKRISGDCRWYALALLAGIFLFVMTIKWSPFHSRYHLPVFVLFAPFLAVVLNSYVRSWGTIILAIVLTAASIPWVFGNTTRPLYGIRNVLTTPRMDQYFYNNIGYSYYMYPLGIAAHQDCKQIGLVFGEGTWEYPLRAISQLQHRKDVRFEHILVDNVSANLPYPLGNFDPCMVIKEGEDNPDFLTWQGDYFKKVYQKGAITTYWRVHL